MVDVEKDVHLVSSVACGPVRPGGTAREFFALGVRGRSAGSGVDGGGQQEPTAIPEHGGAAPVGLSEAHICPRGQEGGEAAGEQYRRLWGWVTGQFDQSKPVEREQVWGRLFRLDRFRKARHGRDGSCVDSVSGEVLAGGDEPSYRLETWKGGDYVRFAIDGGERVRQVRGGGDRGAVKVLSGASRRRLCQELGKLNQKHLPTCVDLTYPNEWDCNGRVWKRDLKAFIQRFERQYGKRFMLWVLEPQGRGAPHFHLRIWMRGDFIDKEWVSRSWYEVVGSGDDRHLRAGTRVEASRSWRGVSYTCSYLLRDKHPVPEEWKDAGRFWGFRHKEMADRLQEDYQLTKREYTSIQRVARKYVEKRLRNGKCKRRRPWWRKRLARAGRRSMPWWAFIPGEVVERLVMWQQWLSCGQVKAPF